MKLFLVIVFGFSLVFGVGLMWWGGRLNVKKGKKRYHPGDKWVNYGLVTVVVSGIALAMVGFLEFEE